MSCARFMRLENTSLSKPRKWKMASSVDMALELAVWLPHVVLCGTLAMVAWVFFFFLASI